MKVIIKRPGRGGGLTTLGPAGPAANVAGSRELTTERPCRQVLLVEDEPSLRRVLARNLTGRGLEVREAATAGEALDAIAAEAPDLLLLDINLPDRSGWDVMREMNRRGTYVPTIVVSAVRVSQTRLDEFRPVAYLPKPFPIEALLRLIFKTPQPDADGTANES